jgi:hypothetical protein
VGRGGCSGGVGGGGRYMKKRGCGERGGFMNEGCGGGEGGKRVEERKIWWV